MKVKYTDTDTDDDWFTWNDVSVFASDQIWKAPVPFLGEGGANLYYKTGK